MYLLATIGLLLVLLFEIIQPLAKVAGMAIDRNATAGNLSLKLLIGNRVGAVMFFPAISYVIESGASTQSIAWLLSIAIGVAIGSVFAINARQERVLNELSRIISPSSKSRKIGSTPTGKGKPGPIGFLAGLSSLLGMIGPLLVASEIPRYRLTITQLGSVFNAVFTLLIVFVVDANISKYCDNKDEQVYGYLKSYLTGRQHALVVAFLILAVIACS